MRAVFASCENLGNEENGEKGIGSGTSKAQLAHFRAGAIEEVCQRGSESLQATSDSQKQPRASTSAPRQR
eukprot:68320-Pleurochrysis_carterae.AAC.3